jgi:hypothetical protein
MAKRKTTPLDGNLVRKGDAVPAAATMPAAVSDIPHGTKDTIAITVRLDPQRYQQLMTYKAQFGKRVKNQDLFITMFDTFMAQEMSTC